MQEIDIIKYLESSERNWIEFAEYLREHVNELNSKKGNPFRIDSIKEHVELYSTKIVVIDYLQLLGIGKYNSGREAEIGHICRVLKVCAKELNICIEWKTIDTLTEEERNNLR